MEPGIYPGLSRDQYELIVAANFSTLKHFKYSPAHAREYMLHPPEPTQAMELGTALHAAILEPDKFNQQYIQAPLLDRRTKDGKAAWVAFEAQHPGRDYLTPDEWEKCNGIIKAIAQNETSMLLLRGEGANELTAVWVDEETGVLCKGRLDRFTTLYGWSVVVDVKSAADAHHKSFPYQAARLSYHVQAAFYVDGLKAIAPTDRRFVTLVIEKDRPHGINAFEYTEESLADGREQYRSYLKDYKKCIETGNWPGYQSGINPLSIPNWARKEIVYE